MSNGECLCPHQTTGRRRPRLALGRAQGRVRAFVAAVKATFAEHPAAHRRLEQPLAIRARPWLPVEQRRFFFPRAGALLDPASQTVEHALAPPYRRQGAPGARHHLVIGQGRIAYDRVLVSGPWAASAGGPCWPSSISSAAYQFLRSRRRQRLSRRWSGSNVWPPGMSIVAAVFR